MPSSPGNSPIVLVERQGAVATVSLNRPERRNALNYELISALHRTMADLGSDETVRAVVLTGSGKSFCAGLDLRELGSTGDNLLKVGAFAGETGPWDRLSKPVVGAVNGPAVTGGLEIALHCDFLIASDRARFGDTHARVGVLPGWGLSYLLPQAVGVRRAREMSLTGRLVGAAEALRWGLVNRIVAADELIDTACAVAATMAETDPAIAAEFLTLYADNVSGTIAAASERETERSTAWADRVFKPELVAQRADAVIERGRAQA
ncbi:enoyl-CoA hydratase/carnithine racemase [Mycobacterium tuberculosis]|nr:enoyl-CoA hydratase/carnithine racemase [Mycobacterium tuberculosis]